jgi:hypothetical protein
MNTEKNVATIPFWKHEYEVWKHRKVEKKLAVALFTVTAISVLLTHQLKKH